MLQGNKAEGKNKNRTISDAALALFVVSEVVLKFKCVQVLCQ
jgi:hypothetical protein